MTARRTAALFTLAALTLGACGQADSDVATGMAAPSTTERSGGPGQGVGRQTPGVTDESADDTVRSWVAALAEGDLQEAWRLVAGRSRAAIGGFDAFTDLSGSLAGRFGVWAVADDDAFSVVPLETGANEAFSVVVLYGTVREEGVPVPVADAVPVRTTRGGSRVEPFLDLGPVEHQPPSGTVVPGDSTLAAVVPMLADVQFLIDHGEVEIPAMGDAPGEQQLASLELDGALEPGPHSLTVVLTNPQGEIATSTASYLVAG